MKKEGGRVKKKPLNVIEGKGNQGWGEWRERVKSEKILQIYVIDKKNQKNLANLFD